jgi:NTP pyrophosphatase (non-canonical NTP hydrolase)
MTFTPETLAVLNQLRDHVAENARKHGFKDPPKGIPLEVWQSPELDVVRAAIYSSNQHGEASEFWEAARKGKLGAPCDKSKDMIALNLPPLTNAQEEIADEIIRALDKAAEFKVDVAEAVSVKMAFNATRPHKHGGKLA